MKRNDAPMACHTITVCRQECRWHQATGSFHHLGM